jgi:hypothetical protein
MAQTKAIATYAVTTLSLLTKGPKKVIWEVSLVLSRLPANAENSKRFRPVKSALLYYLRSRPRRTAGNVVKDL